VGEAHPRECRGPVARFRQLVMASAKGLDFIFDNADKAARESG
jgi:hypothetical protein